MFCIGVCEVLVLVCHGEKKSKSGANTRVTITLAFRYIAYYDVSKSLLKTVMVTTSHMTT